VQAELDTWTTMILGLQNDGRGYVASGQRQFVERLPEQVERTRAQAARLELLLADNPHQLRALDETERAAERTLEHVQRQVERLDSGQREQAIASLSDGEGQRLLASFREAAGRLSAEEARVLRERRSDANQRAWLTLAAATAVALGAYVLLAFAWRREVEHEATVAELARSARERLAVLSRLATGLSDARSEAEVAEVVVEQGLKAARGDTCTLYTLQADGKALRLIGQRGVPTELVEGLRVISSDSAATDVLSAVLEDRSVWAENEAEYASIYPQLAGAKVSGRRAKAFWSMPLKAEGRCLGLLGVGFYEPRRFSADERAFVDTLARQCAQALLRATRRAAEEETRQWFSTTLRSIGDAVIATNHLGKVTFLNEIAERLTGWSESEALGQPLELVFDIISEVTRQPTENPVDKVLREGKVVGLANHTLLRPKTGPELPIDDSGAPIRNEAGEVVGVVLVFRDVSREKRLESRNGFLAKAGEVLASSLDYQTTLGVVARLAVPQLADWCAIDLVEPESGAIRQVAVAHAELDKVRFAEDMGRRYPPTGHEERGAAQVIRSGKSELYAELPPAILEAGARDDEHLRLLRALDLRSALIVPLIGHGRTLGAMTFVYAASDRRYDAEDLAFAEEVARRAAMAIENSGALKEAEDAHQRERWLRAEAERANQLKDEFLATVSHELRTPLNAILGWTLTLRRGSLDVQVDRALAIVERNARAQARLIDDVLDVSRIVSGKLTLRMGPTNVAAAARSALETVTPAADAKGIAITTDIPDDVTLITADASRLQQVIWNLLSNSVKFTPKGGRVTLRVLHQESDVALSVTDTGEGIAPELLGAVFEPFQQADSSSTRRHGGLGLGLSIVKQLVTAHGGAVRAESAGPGQGSTFTVRLPLRAVAPSSAELPAPTITTAVDDPLVATASSARLDGLRVLVVDDEPDAR
ncbi:MAG TPA: ATP-binding protein, partial [Polyangiaceae bacterium]